MNRNLVNRLLIPVLVSGLTITVLSSNNSANAQSANSCQRYLSNMNPMGSDFYERMSAFQRCVSQWMNSLPKQPSQSNYSNGSAGSCALVDSQIANSLLGFN
jgi:hypothetical protein